MLKRLDIDQSSFKLKIIISQFIYSHLAKILLEVKNLSSLWGVNIVSSNKSEPTLRFFCQDIHLAEQDT